MGKPRLSPPKKTYPSLSPRMVLRYEHACNGECPENGQAVVACKDGDGNNLYVARAKYKGVCPGKLVAGCNGVYIGWGEQQHLMEEYEILVQDKHDNLQWLHACNGEVPSGASAVKAGHEWEGPPLYVARGKVNGCMSVGKMNQKYKSAFLTYDGKEHAVDEYEVLCVKEVLDMTP